MKQEITIPEFLEIQGKLEIQMGQIVEAERVPKSTKMIKLIVSFGPSGETKTVLTNLGDNYEPDVFIGLIIPFVTNLAPSKIMGFESQAMIVVGTDLNGKLEFENYGIGTKLI